MCEEEERKDREERRKKTEERRQKQEQLKTALDPTKTDPRAPFCLGFSDWFLLSVSLIGFSDSSLCLVSVLCCVVLCCVVLLSFGSWVDFWSFWGCLGSIFGHLGGLWGGSWAVLEAS